MNPDEQNAIKTFWLAVIIAVMTFVFMCLYKFLHQ